MKQEEFKSIYRALVKETEKVMKRTEAPAASVGIRTRNGSRLEIAYIEHFDEIGFDVYKHYDADDKGAFRDGLFTSGKPGPSYVPYSEISVLFASIIPAEQKS